MYGIWVINSTVPTGPGVPRMVLRNYSIDLADFGFATRICGRLNHGIFCLESLVPFRD